jgi:hypothetical protein
MKVLNRPIERRSRKPCHTSHEGDTSSPQALSINSSDKVLLSLIQVWEQQGIFLFKFFSCTHTKSIPQIGPSVTAIYLRALSVCARIT